MSEEFREVLYTIDTKGRRKWVYSSVIEGFFRSKRKVVSAILILLYLSLPWLTINGLQAVHLDIFSRRFVFFGQIFWATDTKFLFLTLLLLGLCLFFFTALFGRVWCGWACPQTVFLEFIFRPIERLIEGNAVARNKLDQAPWNARKIFIKSVKYGSYLIISWYMANTFLAYFIGKDALLTMMTSLPSENPGIFILSIIMICVVAFEFGWFREQFCTVVCPYARFQSVLLDENSLVVSYDLKRGEPRGKSNEGDCIDCNLCVKVCPTGIDIRNGLQLECIHCTSCIDACNSVMQKINKPLGLIRYNSENTRAGEKFKFFRVRTYIYGSILTVVCSIFLYFILSRQLSEISIFHSKTETLFSVMGSEISNQLELHVENKSLKTQYYSIRLLDDIPAKLVIPIQPYPVATNKHERIPVFVQFKPEILKSGKLPIRIEVTEGSDFSKVLKIDLLGPG